MTREVCEHGVHIDMDCKECFPGDIMTDEQFKKVSDFMLAIVISQCGIMFLLAAILIEL